MTVSISKARRIVVKIGSALIIGANEREINSAWLDGLAADIAALRKQGREIVLVSSGAVALGRDVLGVGMKELKLEEKQAAAACGQMRLVEGFRRSLDAHDLSPAQILLSIEDSDNRRRFLNARNTIETLIRAGVIPVINENDTVATEELRFGDNDRLAARVAQMIGADVLVLLSDVDGLYERNPALHPDAAHIPRVEAITEVIESMAGKPLSHTGSGGMVTKIMAARIAVASGCHTVIALGKAPNPLKRLAEGARHTLFVAHGDPASAKKNWIAHRLTLAGEIIIDEGALKAIKNGKSLLPAGVKQVTGNFERGDAVVIKTPEGKEIGRGLVAYSVGDARRIAGHKSAEIASILGFPGRDELIHRDDMTLCGQ